MNAPRPVPSSQDFAERIRATPRIRVALIEDDPEQSRSIRDAVAADPDLEMAGTFETGEEAVAHLADGEPDVALVDIGLPGLSGTEVVAACQPHMPRTQFMMLTVIEDSGKVYSALAAGATGYLLKKDVPKRLAPAVHELRAGGSPMSGSIARQVVLAFQRSGLGPGFPGGATAERKDEPLSEREREILRLLEEGRLYKEIGDHLGIALGTVNTHIRRIYEKLQVHSRAEATRYARGG